MPAPPCAVAYVRATFAAQSTGQSGLGSCLGHSMKLALRSPTDTKVESNSAVRPAHAMVRLHGQLRVFMYGNHIWQRNRVPCFITHNTMHIYLRPPHASPHPILFTNGGGLSGE